MRDSGDFAFAVRRGRRSGNKLVVVHSHARAIHLEADLPTKVGFIVGKKVGNSVVRHTVSRKLRHVMRDLLPKVTADYVVVRANPEAASATSAELREAIVSCLEKTGALGTKKRNGAHEVAHHG